MSASGISTKTCHLSVTHTVILEETGPPSTGLLQHPALSLFDALSKALRSVGIGYDWDQGAASQPLGSVSDP